MFNYCNCHFSVQAAKGTLDGIIDSVSAHHSLVPLINLLKTGGKLVMVGLPDLPLELPVFPILRMYMHIKNYYTCINNLPAI